MAKRDYKISLVTTVYEKLNADKAKLIKLPTEDHACKNTTYNRPLKRQKACFKL